MSFELTAKQKQANELLASDATHIMLFGGSRSGKTFLLCRAIAVRALKAPGSRHAILRFRFNHCKQSVVLDTWPKMMGLCFPGVEGTTNKTDWFYQFPNGSQVWFGGLDEKDRSEKILGMEFVTIFLNECSQIPQSSRDITVTRLAQCVAQRIDGKDRDQLAPKMYYDCNPPAKTHWSYRIFVKKQDLDTKKPLANQDDYAYFKINPHDNADNLSKTYLTTLQGLGARLRKRFLDGEFQDATDGALFSDVEIDKWRVMDADMLPDMVRVVVAVDPSGSGDDDNAGNDAIGVAVCGLGSDGNGYLLADLTVKAGPKTWGRVVTDAFDTYEANLIVAEQNFGGAMVKHVIDTSRPRTPFKSVTASRGKHIRAEPISALYEQGRIRHAGQFLDLEEELAGFTVNGYSGESSPNRADAVIWGFTELFGGIVKEKKESKPIRKSSSPQRFGWMA